MGLFRRELREILHLNSVRRFSRDSTNNVRVRFAPSPTGFIHLGGLRTAFFNYLFARKHNGKFILRIEDTDRERIVPGSLEHIIQTLTWAQLSPDEGPTFGGAHGPYIQSERSELYKEMIQKLIDNHSAYHCFCSSKRLDLLRREAAKNRETIKYDNRCRSLSSEEIKENILTGKPYTIRLKLKEGPMTVDDMVYGSVTYDLSKTEGDPILVKSDGLPTYHFANVVDDHFMEISHVLRGVEWLISTPKHLMLYEALGWSQPRYAHLPLIVNKDGTKLSKRHDHIKIDAFREVGYYPETIDNYLTQMGGGFGALSTTDCQKIFSLPELAENFTLENVNQNPSKIDLDKLKLLNRVCIRQLSIENITGLVEQLQDLFQQKSLTMDKDRVNDIEYIRRVINWSLDRIFTFNDLCLPEFQFIWSKPSFTWKPDSFASPEVIKPILQDVLDILRSSTENDLDKTEEMIESLKKVHSSASDMKYGTFMRLLRFALTDLKAGSPVVETMQLLGRTRSIEHLESALYHVEAYTFKKDNQKIN